MLSQSSDTVSLSPVYHENGVHVFTSDNIKSSAVSHALAPDMKCLLVFDRTQYMLLAFGPEADAFLEIPEWERAGGHDAAYRYTSDKDWKEDFFASICAACNDGIPPLSEEDFAVHAVSCGLPVSVIPERLLGNKAFMVNLAKADGYSALQYAGKKLRDDAGVAGFAVENNTDALEFVSDGLLKSGVFREILLRHTPDADVLMDVVMTERRYVLEQEEYLKAGYVDTGVPGSGISVTERDEPDIPVIHPNMPEERKAFIREAIEKGVLPADAAERPLMERKEDVLALAEYDSSRTARFLPLRVRDDKEIAEKCVNKDVRSYQLLPFAARADRGLALEAIRLMPEAIRFVPASLKNDPNFIEGARRVNPALRNYEPRIMHELKPGSIFESASVDTEWEQNAKDEEQKASQQPPGRDER